MYQLGYKEGLKNPTDDDTIIATEITRAQYDKQRDDSLIMPVFEAAVDTMEGREGNCLKETKMDIKKIIKEELQAVLKEAEANHAFGIGMEIVEDWRPWASSPGAITKAWQSLFEALDELPNGVTIAKQLQKISNDYLERYEKQQDERYAK